MEVVHQYGKYRGAAEARRRSASCDAELETGSEPAWRYYQSASYRLTSNSLITNYSHDYLRLGGLFACYFSFSMCCSFYDTWFRTEEEKNISCYWENIGVYTIDFSFVGPINRIRPGAFKILEPALGTTRRILKLTQSQNKMRCSEAQKTAWLVLVGSTTTRWPRVHHWTKAGRQGVQQEVKNDTQLVGPAIETCKALTARLNTGSLVLF
jgi:hypothetical protein